MKSLEKRRGIILKIKSSLIIPEVIEFAHSKYC